MNLEKARFKWQSNFYFWDNFHTKQLWRKPNFFSTKASSLFPWSLLSFLDSFITIICNVFLSIEQTKFFLCPATFRLQLRRRRRRQREGRRRQKRFLRVGRPMIYGLREGKKTLPDDRFLRQKRQINVKIQAWSEGCGSGTWAQCGW